MELSLPGEPEISADAFWRPMSHLMRNNSGSAELDPGWRKVARPYFANLGRAQASARFKRNLKSRNSFYEADCGFSSSG